MKNFINFKYIMNMFINLKNISYKLWAICIIHKIYEQFHKLQKYFKYIMNKFLNRGIFSYKLCLINNIHKIFI